MMLLHVVVKCFFFLFSGLHRLPLTVSRSTVPFRLLMASGLSKIQWLFSLVAALETEPLQMCTYYIYSVWNAALCQYVGCPHLKILYKGGESLCTASCGSSVRYVSVHFCAVIWLLAQTLTQVLQPSHGCNHQSKKGFFISKGDSNTPSKTLIRNDMRNCSIAVTLMTHLKARVIVKYHVTNYLN